MKPLGLEITLGITLPRNGPYAGRVLTEKERMAAKMLASLPGRPEEEKTKVAELLFRVIADDPEIDPPWGAGDAALEILRRLDSEDPKIQLACWENVTKNADPSGYTRVLLGLSSPSDALVDAVRSHVAERLDGAGSEPAKIDMEVTRLAFAFGVGDRLRADTLAVLEAELASGAPDVRRVGEMMRRLWHCPDVPEEVVTQVASLVDVHLATTELGERFDGLVAGYSVFCRAQDRADLVDRFTRALDAAWTDAAPAAYAVGCWVHLVRDVTRVETKAAARDLVLGRYPEGPFPQALAHAWKYQGPESHPLPDRTPTG